MTDDIPPPDGDRAAEPAAAGDRSASPPRETIDDVSRQLRESISGRLDDYLELWRDSARAWDRREYDAKRLLRDTTAWFELGVRDVLSLWRQPFQLQWATRDDGPPSVIAFDVQIEPQSHSATLTCTDLEHAQHGGPKIASHAVQISPNPVPAGTDHVTIRFDGFQKPQGAYVGQLVVYDDKQADHTIVGDIVAYVGGNDRRF